MALTENEISIIANSALSRIAVGTISEAAQSDVKGLEVNRHYAQTRDALLRSYLWPFAKSRDELVQIQLLELDTPPEIEPDEVAWSVGDVITGLTSGTTGVILTVHSALEYDVGFLDGEFEDGEDIQNQLDAPAIATGAEGYPEMAILQPTFNWSFAYAMPLDFIRLWSVYEDDGFDPVDRRWEIEGRRILTHYNTVNVIYTRQVTNPVEFDALFTEVLILRLAMKLINPLAGTASEQFRAELRQELMHAEGRARTVCAQEANTTGRSDWNLARFE